ncbi:caspase family protein [Pseudomonas fluorescens]|uniref:caspase family protein n=1 Tax=Pseudomonas fluorescens TaxID=294 RepID=UPI001A9D495C|nr:caspase family protein [Pseudomonas fluorescens]QTD31711.1 caspase family protein [Pseudomonas fluorescens]
MSKQVGLVAVGVDDVGADLPVLKGAAAGARRIVKWLESQRAFGIECECILLADGPRQQVTTRNVLDATYKLVDGGGLDLLILYYSSHGIVQSANSELVLLSLAGRYSNEAIDIASTIHNARYLNIPHVLIISDACRNAVDPFSRLGRLSGVAAVQPLSVAGRRPGKVDIFYATEPSQTAKEYKGDGFFTQVLLETLYQPPVEVCEHWSNYPNPVIPTWKLENYLFEQVPRRAGNTEAAFEQTPDFLVTSREPMFLGFANLEESALKNTDNSEQEVHQLDDEATFQDSLREDSWRGFIEEELEDFGPRLNEIEEKQTLPSIRGNRRALKYAASDFLQSRHNEVDQSLLVRAGLWDAYCLVEDMSHHGDGALRSGLRLYGCSTVRVLTPKNRKYETYDGSPIDISTFGFNFPSHWHYSITLILDEISITVLPFYPGYIGHVHIKDGVVQHVSFTPGGEMRRMFGLTEHNMHELRSAQSVAAAFARTGKLASLANEDALNFASYLRRNKRIDPTLGVYATYAYTLAGQQEGVESIYDYFQAYRSYSPSNTGSLPIPFDVALLAGRLDSPRMRKGIAPFVPMMNLGWSMLSNVTSSDELYRLHQLRDLRLNAEWTTFALESQHILYKLFNT